MARAVEQLVRAAIEPSGYSTTPEPDVLATHLAHAERVLADAAWDALSTPRPGDSLEKIDLPLTPTTVERAGRRQGITGVLLLPYSPERQR